MSNKPYNVSSKHSGEWWHTDSAGRRIGYVWPEDFKISIDAIWGNRKGISGFAKYAGLARATVEEYCNGRSAVPKHIALLVMALTQIVHRWDEDYTARGRTRDFPKIEADWLPKRPKDPKKGLESRPHG